MGRQRKPRPLAWEELQTLIEAALARPLYDALLVRRGRRKGQLVAKVSDDRGHKLHTRGWERALAYKLLTLTGLRVSELASVRVRDLDLDANRPTLFVHGKHTKNGQDALIALRQDLADDLDAWLRKRTFTHTD